ncbi:hypothetical protein KFK09_007001 [Dendrobium nobile]|uniref:HECT-type E3 ubiquitin transferase n=1 Tax=Dendrobium nobile TaxID=94219 RepID=A0A8T3BV84_DENNO|nr:hypothetical protein KFK09_007001 [Dendrobium nobile]
MMLFPDRSSVFQEFHEMLIDRPQLLNESFEYIGQVEASALRGELFVVFKNEEATGPGVLREWFRLVCHAIFSPQHVLFLSCPNNPRRFFPNPGSDVDSLHLKYFSFVGRVIALALMHKIQIGITFDRAFFLQLSGKTITLEDIQDADPFLYMSCKKILWMDDDILDSDVLGLTFVREIEAHDSHRTVELCPGGMKIVVNSRNRKEYVALLIQNCFVTSIAEQIHHFSQGFSDIFSETKLHKLFFRSLDVEDFNKLLGGSDDAINVNDWKAHTEYGGYEEKDCQISWFWKRMLNVFSALKRMREDFDYSVFYLLNFSLSFGFPKMAFGFPVLVVFRALAPWLPQLAVSVPWLLGFLGGLLVFRAGWPFPCPGASVSCLASWISAAASSGLGWAVSHEALPQKIGCRPFKAQTLPQAKPSILPDAALILPDATSNRAPDFASRCRRRKPRFRQTLPQTEPQFCQMLLQMEALQSETEATT